MSSEKLTSGAQRTEAQYFIHDYHNRRWSSSSRDIVVQMPTTSQGYADINQACGKEHHGTGLSDRHRGCRQDRGGYGGSKPGKLLLLNAPGCSVPQKGVVDAWLTFRIPDHVFCAARSCAKNVAGVCNKRGCSYDAWLDRRDVRRNMAGTLFNRDNITGKSSGMPQVQGVLTGTD